MIQPFEFLGVTLRSSPSEVRRAYYQMAMLCHPDRGGSKEDMHVVHAAYQWIMDQISVSSMSYEEKQEEFDSFLKSQSSQPLPSMTEISLEAYGVSIADAKSFFEEHAPSIWTNDLSRFTWFLMEIKRLLFVSSNDSNVFSDALSAMTQGSTVIDSACIEGGYGANMASDECEDVPSFGKTEMIIYKEPVSSQDPRIAPIIKPSSLDNYTIHDALLPMQDYKQAFCETEQLDIEASTMFPQFKEPFLDVEAKLLELEAVRKLMDMQCK